MKFITPLGMQQSIRGLVINIISNVQSWEGIQVKPEYVMVTIMGAGKGQQHRIKTVAGGSGASLKSVDSLKGMRVDYSWKTWNNWIQAKGIQHVKLFSYYLKIKRLRVLRLTINSLKNGLVILNLEKLV